VASDKFCRVAGSSNFDISFNTTTPTILSGAPNDGKFWENELALQLTQPLLRDFGVGG
jgi:hypothetical protein